MLKTTRVATWWLLLLVVVLAGAGSVVAQEINLLDRSGRQVAYISVERDYTIYLWEGAPVAYLHASSANVFNVYSFDGTHLGWFEDGIVWDLSGDAVGFEEGTQNIPTIRSGPKGVKRLPPLRSIRDLSKAKPPLSYRFSTTNSLGAYFLGSTSSSTGSRPSLPSPSTPGYAGVGMRHWVQRVEQGGALVVLEDGTRWEIQLIDRIYTMLWLPVDDIRVDNARSPIGAFTYTLTHTRDGRAVLARFLGR